MNCKSQVIKLATAMQNGANFGELLAMQGMTVRDYMNVLGAEQAVALAIQAKIKEHVAAANNDMAATIKRS